VSFGSNVTPKRFGAGAPVRKRGGAESRREESRRQTRKSSRPGARPGPADRLERHHPERLLPVWSPGQQPGSWVWVLRERAQRRARRPGGLTHAAKTDPEDWMIVVVTRGA
jgi:hypothetical protein